LRTPHRLPKNFNHNLREANNDRETIDAVSELLNSVPTENLNRIRDLSNVCVALVGKIGAGKSTLASYLSKDLNWKLLSISKFLEHLARNQGKEVRRESLQNLGLAMIKRNSLQFCKDALSFAGWTSSEGLVIDGLRDIVLFEGFKMLVNPMPSYLVYIQINENLRHLRLSLDRKTPIQNIFRFEEHPVEKGIETLHKCADLVLENRDSSSDLANQLYVALKDRQPI
jgi:dephospho-CoA kinase